jgi:hypothetical protein
MVRRVAGAASMTRGGSVIFGLANRGVLGWDSSVRWQKVPAAPGGHADV